MCINSPPYEFLHLTSAMNIPDRNTPISIQLSHHLNNTTKCDKAVKLAGIDLDIQELIGLKREGRDRTD